MDEILSSFSDEAIKEIESVLHGTQPNTYKARTVKLDKNDIQWEPFEKYTAMKKHYVYDDQFPNNSNNSEQINSLWQEIKRMQNEIKDCKNCLLEQSVVIKDLKEKFNEIGKDRFEEINDRIDDLESKIDLLDE